jgi:hypothetical protein
VFTRIPQVDFGRDPLGRQIFTLTNIEGDIYCASHGLSATHPSHFCYMYHCSAATHTPHTYATESQLLPTHRVTVRYQAENPHTDAHYARVGMYNAALWDRIKPRPLYAPPQAQDPQANAQALDPKALALQAQAQVFWAAQKHTQASLRWTDTEHCFHKVGSVIKVTKVHHKKFNPYINFEGVIRRIVARGPDFMFFVQIQRNALGDAVNSDTDITDLNRRSYEYLRPDERGLLPCKNMHMSREWGPQTPPQDDQGPAKKPRLEGQ